MTATLRSSARRRISASDAPMPASLQSFSGRLAPNEVPHLGLRQMWKFLLTGIAFHAIYILSIFDIYFRSPLIKNLPVTNSILPAPAKRLVLFVGDGLRADKCFEFDSEGNPRAPFLREMARTRGAWGISHTRVPTESRPGHVAMIAGFYEDVSAVTKGWKHNPVEFDHVLRQASYAWAFGAPEIVQLFPGERVTTQFYPESMIDFSKDALELDKWSFEHLQNLFIKAQKDASLGEKLKSDKVVIFVHLLGLDTNGHAFYPHSREYLENVSFVDQGVRRAVEMIDNFYGDGKTAYIFTSDHGMSDAGTHGDGDPDNTRCPLIVWGAGADGPRSVPLKERLYDEWSAPWQLSDTARRDVNQADLTPLMATLVGIPIPTNSEGVLPIDYIEKGKDEFKTRAALNNLRQLAVCLNAKEEHRQKQEPFFRPFRHPAQSVKLAIDQAEGLINKGKYSQSIDLINETRDRVFQGLSYYQKYDWLLLRSVVALGYISWMIYSITYLSKSYSTQSHIQKPSRIYFALGAISLGVLSATYLNAKSAPIQYYLYFGFPIYFAFQTFDLMLSGGLKVILKVLNLEQSWYGLLLYTVGMEALVLSFFNRYLLAVVAPIVGLTMVRLVQLPTGLRPVLLLGCFSIVSIFPTLQPIKLPSSLLLYGGVLLTLGFGMIAVMLSEVVGRRMQRSLTKLVILAIAGGVTWRADSLFAAKEGLPIYLQVIAWIIFTYAVVGTFMQTSSGRASERILDIFLTIAPAYSILSISYEPLFFLAFAAAPIIWIRLKEAERVRKGNEEEGSKGLILCPFDTMMLFLAFKFISYFLLAFFGTGNFASISSFTLPSVYRLITVFSPFCMAALLLIKLFLPMVFLAASFGMMLRMLRVEGERLFIMVVATMDVMTLSFFFLVRDHGSWLEIGTSISHFVLASVFSLATLTVFSLSRFLLRGVAA